MGTDDHVHPIVGPTPALGITGDFDPASPPLTDEEQKRDMLYDNAARFLRISEERSRDTLVSKQIKEMRHNTPIHLTVRCAARR